MLEMNAKVVDVLPGSQFKVVLMDENYNEISQNPIKAILAGKLRQNYVKILQGDYVLVEISPYDVNTARIKKRIDISKINK